MSRIASVDIHGWIGFCVTELLRIEQGVGILRSFFGHLRQNVVARAVQDPSQREDLIRCEALRDVRDDRNSTTDACFKSDGSAELSGAIE